MSLTFNGINEGGFGGYELTDQLLYNIKWFLDHNLAKNGAYGVYEYDDSGDLDESFYSDDESKLSQSIDERYETGKVWEGVGREWVWESGISLGSGAISPFRVSGVYVDGDFFSTSHTGINRFHVDYINGRIIFDEPKSSDTEIHTNYTRRSVYVGFADTEEFRVMMRNAVEDFLTDTLPSGTPNRENQIWFPSVFIEVQDGEGRGLQLGGGQIKTRNIIFHIFADNPQDRNLLMDWLDYQSRATFFMADLNNITFPFDEYGDIVSGVTNWPNMTTQNPWKKLRGMSMRSSTLNSLNSKIFKARVIWEVEVDFGGI